MSQAKTIAQHKRDGTLRKQHKHTLEGEPLKTVPRVPSSLLPLGAKKWKILAGILVKYNQLTEMDLDILTNFCIQVDIIADCYQEIKDKGVMVEGSYSKIKNPAFLVMKEAIEIQNRISTRFGFTPVDRAKVQIGKPSETDPIDDFLKQFEN